MFLLEQYSKSGEILLPNPCHSDGQNLNLNVIPNKWLLSLIIPNDVPTVYHKYFISI